jgi:hypothetical protein
MLDALRDLIRGIVREELGQLQADAGTWTSASLPPGCPSKRAFATACRQIAGAMRVGRGWTCSREAWAQFVAYRTEARRQVALARASDVPQNGVISLAEKMLSRSTRPTRAGGDAA